MVPVCCYNLVLLEVNFPVYRRAATYSNFVTLHFNPKCMSPERAFLNDL